MQRANRGVRFIALPPKGIVRVFVLVWVRVFLTWVQYSSYTFIWNVHLLTSTNTIKHCHTPGLFTLVQHRLPYDKSKRTSPLISLFLILNPPNLTILYSNFLWTRFAHSISLPLLPGPVYKAQVFASNATFFLQFSLFLRMALGAKWLDNVTFYLPV